MQRIRLFNEFKTMNTNIQEIISLQFVYFRINKITNFDCIFLLSLHTKAHMSIIRKKRYCKQMVIVYLVWICE